MNIAELAELVQNEPVFASALLRVRGNPQAQIRVQLVRWVKAGRLTQLRRGVYVLAKPYRKIEPHPFVMANSLSKASYVSCQSALGFYGLIPEHVPVVTSATTGRPEKITTPMGSFLFRHLKKGMFAGYRRIAVGDRQEATIAVPEKALVDLLYLTPEGDSDEYILELRLQNMETIDPKALMMWADRTGSPKVVRSVRKIMASREPS
jgi:predicted transcriptional regulator of viral defense system